MLKAQMTVSLPSVETSRRMGPLEWLQSLCGKTIDLRSGEEELTLSAFALLRALYEAFRKVGVTDAITFLVDKQVIYADPDAADDDLDLILRMAENAGLFTRRFTEMHLALAHRDHGLHTIVDIKIHSHVMRGEDEMALTLSGRVEDLRIAEGESAAGYAARIRAFGEHPETMEAYRSLLDALQERLGEALRTAIPGADVHATPAEICLIWPDDKNIGRFRRLRFGEEVEEPRYRPVPTRRQYGVYNDPYYLYYYDPYYALTNWLLLDTLLRHSTWPSPAIHVLQSDGTPVDVLHHTAAAAGAWAAEAVHFDATGDLQVDAAMPDDWGGADVRESSSAWDRSYSVDAADEIDAFGGADMDENAWGGSEVSETTSANTAWGGSDISDSSSSDASWGGSEVSDSNSSCGSSCGSSCSSSSSC